MGALALLAGLLAAPPAEASGTQTLLALGDSITRAATTCGANRDCADNSWATGSATAVDSIASRMAAADPRTAVRAVNYAKSGAVISGVESRIDAAADAGEEPDVVTLLIGGNDLCSLTLSPESDGYAMTPAASFAASATGILRSIGEEWPEATVLVGSVPDIESEWEAVRPTPGAAIWAWGGVCRTQRGVDATTGAPLTGSAYTASLAAAEDREADFNSALESACASAANDCVWDGGALTAAPISLDQLSTDVDYFHPNVAGQAMIAEELWTAWGLGDGPAPTPTPAPTTAPTAAPAPAPTDSPAPPRDTTAPRTVITAPTSGSTVRGSVTLVASAQDDVGTTRLSFWSGATRLGDATRASGGTWRLTVSASSYPAGRYAIVAHAYDAAGNLGRSASITLKR
ncbi:GDSL-type esterase/lipase family protein [Rathayibacter sp. AY2B3]|uniref:GDSL-type esterase/lipase family protein n=1 Tax=Rathayibacter sp. AY2B3 TaxID=2080569 RepID=UPI0015E3263D|nr:GDSL-type esterase/lipase family protein [Rathayibacter sp. AY2B3]